MKPALCAIGLAFLSLAAFAQAPAPGAPSATSDMPGLGFQYAPPSGWRIEAAPSNSSPSSPPASSAPSAGSSSSSPNAAGHEPAQSAAAPAAKKGIACLEAPLTATYGDPRSVLVEVVLPFDCFGQTIGPDQLPAFTLGIAAGMKQSLDTSDAIESAYTLGTHRMWVQRSKGNEKGHPVAPFTFEIACGLLRKAAVCWTVAANDAAALAAFENASVTLEDDPPTPLVPATVFP
jgi:hypothetical protein